MQNGASFFRLSFLVPRQGGDVCGGIGFSLPLLCCTSAVNCSAQASLDIFFFFFAYLPAFVSSCLHHFLRQKKRKQFSLSKKVDILQEVEARKKQAAVAKEHGVARFTTATTPHGSDCGCATSSR